MRVREDVLCVAVGVGNLIVMVIDININMLVKFTVSVQQGR